MSAPTKPAPDVIPPSPHTVELAEGVSRAYLRHHGICPVGFSGDGCLVVAHGSGTEVSDALDELAFAYGRPVIARAAASDEVEAAIERLLAASAHEIALERQDDDDTTADARDLASQPPVIRFVNMLVRDAFDVGASDIHLEAARDGLVTRFRLDGVLSPGPDAPRELRHAIVSRIKLLAELDIAERRRPQDGRIRVRLEARELDLRVSTVPTMHGESLVLRLLDRGGRPVALQELGMSTALFARVERLIAKPHGLLLVTGPTGSGKTTTLYAALGCRDAAAEKIITVEDPVEYQLAGVAQMPVHRQAGVTFGSALRSILRQDPDVVMVGEMRDAETAEVAIQAAMTGHLVLSTLHTNDAIGALPRLLDLGVPEYLIAATLQGVLAQRLVRQVCGSCREPYRPTPEHVSLLARTDDERGDVATRIDDTASPATGFVRGAGCARCRGTGYRGRVGIFELLEVTDGIRDALGRRASRAELRDLSHASGFGSLRADGLAKSRAGLTTIEEVLRVVQT